MSLLKWKELAKSKTELGNKINYVHNAITQHKIGKQASKESFEKVFKPVTSKLDERLKPVTSKLDDVIVRIPQRRPLKKMEVPDYDMDKIDEVEDMNLDNLFGDHVPPQQEKQLGPPPQIYVDPPDEPPKYDYDEHIDYKIPDEELTLERLAELGLAENITDPEKTSNENMKSLNKQIKIAKKEKQRLNGSRTAAINKFKANQNEAELQMKIKHIENDKFILDKYINNIEEQINELKMKAIENTGSGIKGRGILKKVENERNKIKGYKAYVTKKYNGGAISEDERQIMNKLLDDKMTALNKYIKDHKKGLELEKKIKGRGRRQRGGNVMFFNDTKQLLKKLELIIGEVIAGNTSIQMRNMGVNILDALLRMAKINRSQYTK